MSTQEADQIWQILAKLVIAYAIYSPFWVAVAFIHWKFVEAFDQQSYITYCLRCVYPIVFAISLFVIVAIIYRTWIQVLHNPPARKFARELGINALLLLGLVCFVIAAFPIVTYRFMDGS